MDLSQRRELTEGAFYRSHGSFELAMAPGIFALLGLWVDHQLGLVPLFTIALTVLAFVGVCVKHYFVYRYDMAQFAEKKAERV